MTQPSDPVLCIDTTSKILMVAISIEGQIVAHRREASQSHRYHSAMLVPTIEALLNELSIKTSDLSALAINIGPGSFTGIRTGLSSIRTFGQFLDIPVYAFNTFEVLAHNQANESIISRIYIDALQNKAYHARLCFRPEGVHYLTPPALISMSSLENTSLESSEQIIISEKLRPYLDTTSNQDRIQSIETPERFTPHDMCQLIRQYSDTSPHPFLYSWDQVKALYLQAPNITLRKPKADMLK